MITSIAIIHKQLKEQCALSPAEWEVDIIVGLLQANSATMGLALSDEDASRIAQQVVDHHFALV